MSLVYAVPPVPPVPLIYVLYVVPLVSLVMIMAVIVFTVIEGAQACVWLYPRHTAESRSSRHFLKTTQHAYAPKLLDLPSSVPI